eukprot:gene12293-13559_t
MVTKKATTMSTTFPSSCDPAYESSTFSLRTYDDRNHLQTVPDLDSLADAIQQQYSFQAQEVPDYNNMQLPEQHALSDQELTPVDFDKEFYEKLNKITPKALNFDEPDSLMLGGKTMDESYFLSSQECHKESGLSKKRRKTKRKSYLSNDLPVEVRNQRRTVANARERARVGRMANGYDALQKSLPKYLTQPKMRKVDILNSALCHIQNLMNMLASKGLDCNKNIASISTSQQQQQHFAAGNMQLSQYQHQYELYENSNCDNYLSQFVQCASKPNNQIATSFS